MTMIPAFGPWPEHPADADEEKRLASAQQSKTSPLSVDKEHETGVFYGSGKEPYQTSLASCTCNDFVKRKKPCKHIFRLAMELGIIDAAYRRAAAPANETRRRSALQTVLLWWSSFPTRHRMQSRICCITPVSASTTARSL